MNINQLLRRAATNYAEGAYYGAADNSIPYNLYYYKVKETETTVEIPFGRFPNFEEMGVVDVPIIQDSRGGWVRSLPKTGLSIFNNVLGVRGGTLVPYNNFQGVPYLNVTYGLIMKIDYTPIIEFTTVIEKSTLRNLKYICKINATLLNEEDVVCKFIKATVIKNLIANGINTLPCDIVIINDMISPLRRVGPPLTEVERHEAEIHSIMETHTEAIVNLAIPNSR